VKRSVKRIKILATGVAQAPVTVQTVANTGRRLIHGFRAPAYMLRLQKATRETPLILQIETVSICDSACVFCAYPHVKRKKGVMSLALFEKVVKDYAAMGGGPVSLTPIVGDALLDPHLMERLRILKAHPEINQITLTTNAIALGRYSDEDVRDMLQTLFCIQVSIGGLDAATYEMMYGVDRFSQVQEAMKRLIALGKTVPQPANLSFAFRTNDVKFERRFKRRLDAFRREGVFISHIWAYANYSGLITGEERQNLVVHETPLMMRKACIYARAHVAVCWDGRITACGYADFEGDKLPIGHAKKDTLAYVCAEEKRRAIIDSFKRLRPLPICRECSAYRSDIAVFSRPYCREIKPRKPLPIEFFRQFWGG
jgi:MoaA/NifB/PqqE/SkfB family radical SAM enzyme